MTNSSLFELYLVTSGKGNTDVLLNVSRSIWSSFPALLNFNITEFTSSITYNYFGNQHSSQ